MFSQILPTFLRTVFAYVLLLLLVRLIGRKSIAQMTFFNFAVAITLGSVTANLAMGSNPTPIKSATVLITLSILVIGTSILHLKDFKFRKLVNSEPVTIIENGKIIDENMRRLRLSLDDLTSMLRTKNAFNIKDVEFAIMENDGKMSVLVKSQKLPVTPSDLNITTSYKGLTKDIIMDGRIMTENLEAAGLDKSWVTNQLKAQGIANEQEVFYAGLDSSESLYISLKNKGIEKEGKHGIE